jgi:hypothetical protein
MQNTDMQVTLTLLRAASYGDFTAGQEDISYRIDLSSAGIASDEILSIEAELRYQPLTFGHLQLIAKNPVLEPPGFSVQAAAIFSGRIIP